MFLEDLGISSSGLDKLIAASYRILGLISYLTAGETETRAWTITKGTKVRRLPERFTAISKEALLKQKLFTIRIYLTVVHIMEPKRKVL